jgi:hypothetical protein
MDTVLYVHYPDKEAFIARKIKMIQDAYTKRKKPIEPGLLDPKHLEECWEKQHKRHLESLALADKLLRV